ncbi:MAG TPA: redox-regulated ATPase YchF [Bacilli bacterium]|nr:redox-regulated ATPase YchF [Bacilli bacterium]
MALKAGIVGLPNVGKSTLFNAITKKNILVANYPFATIDPNVGMVMVPDKRLTILEDIYKPEEVKPTSFEFVDIAGLVKGASVGEGLGNKFLSHIREVDAICEVVRCFENAEITHVEGTVDPVRDIEIINLELALADLEIINNRIDKIKKKAETTKDKETLTELEALQKSKENLEKNNPLRLVDYTEEELFAIKSYNFLTQKPHIYLANINEEEILEENEHVLKLKEYAKKENSEVVIISAKIESELAELNDDDKKELLNELGLKDSGLDVLIEKAYEILGLETFFTCGDKEVKAWTFKKGTCAKECAGIIHTDFEKGFIKAEIIAYADLVQQGSELKVKEAGKFRIEGKDYIMQDGDICHFRFNL